MYVVTFSADHAPMAPQVVTHFLALEELMDAAAQDRMAAGPGKVQLLLERGGKPVRRRCKEATSFAAV